MARLLALVLALALLVLPGAPPAPAAAAAPAQAAAKKRAKLPTAKQCRKQAIRKLRGRKRAARVKACRRRAAALRRKRRPAPKPPAVAPAPPAAAPSARPRRWSVDEWQRSLSEPRYDGIETSTHYITAADGKQLSLTVHLPAGLPAGEKVPTLVQFTPYRPLDQTAGPGAIGADWQYFTDRGAAYVAADERGTGGSEGCLDFGGALDRSDAQVFAKWIREQPWSNGVIASDGVSHPGMGSVVAHSAIPGLDGALAHAPVVSYYQDEWLQGAKFEDQFNGPLYEAIEVAPPLPPEFLSPEALRAQAAECRGETTLDFTPYDGPFGPLWQDRDLSAHTPAERKPILLTHGFVDLNVHPDHSQMYWDALPDDYPKYAIFGWWYHGWPTPTADFELIRHRWMDALLFKRENGLGAEPRVLVQDSRGVWHEGDDWPLEPSEPVTLRPRADGGLAEDAGPAGSASYPDRPLATRGIWEGAHVAFRSAPLSADKLVNGAPQVDLVASSSATSTKWVVYLMDEAPDGSWQRISHGYADSHTWKSADTWSDLTPGTAYRWTVKLMPTGTVVAAGHRLTLVIASQDSRRAENPGEVAPCFDDHTGGCYSPSGILPATTAGRATNTVLTGPGQTELRLHWVDPAKTRKAPFPLPAE
jgi:uncharacterized protein